MKTLRLFFCLLYAGKMNLHLGLVPIYAFSSSASYHETEKTHTPLRNPSDSIRTSQWVSGTETGPAAGDRYVVYRTRQPPTTFSVFTPAKLFYHSPLFEQANHETVHAGNIKGSPQPRI
jgi:hypothetical protein